MPYHLAHTLSIEAHAIEAAIPLLEPNYPEAIDLLTIRTPIFSGMGKSGIIAQKAAATFRSLGIAATYLHPGDASHGDLGVVQKGSVLVILSNSGNSAELTDLILFCQKTKIPIISITGGTDNPLAEAATASLSYGKVKEACTMGLAPTTSTTVAMAICDALAIDVGVSKAVTPEVFQRHHPGGKLGSQLRKLRDVMRAPVPEVPPTATLPEIAMAMTGEIAGVCLVTEHSKVQGLITDGDLRRAIDMKGSVVLADEIMTRGPLMAYSGLRVLDAVDLMNEQRVSKLLVTNKSGAVIGVVDQHDCK